jgi:hypothetical protein
MKGAKLQQERLEWYEIFTSLEMLTNKLHSKFQLGMGKKKTPSRRTDVFVFFLSFRYPVTQSGEFDLPCAPILFQKMFENF